jgi:hypothetical protein
MVPQPWSDALGCLSKSSGSIDVTGKGTFWAPGDIFRIAGETARIPGSVSQMLDSRFGDDAPVVTRLAGIYLTLCRSSRKRDAR